MASKEMIKDTVIFLHNILKTKMELNDETHDAYFTVLRYYSENDVQKAAEKVMEEMNFMPTPKEWKDLIPSSKKNKQAKELIDRWTCNTCNEKSSAITEGGICLDCAQVNIGFNQKKDTEAVKDHKFVMRANMMCQKCKKGPSVCIKEPDYDDRFLCRNCYSGLTQQERTQRIHDILHMIEDKSFKPSWALSIV